LRKLLINVWSLPGLLPTTAVPESDNVVVVVAKSFASLLDLTPPFFPLLVLLLALFAPGSVACGVIDTLAFT